MSRPIEASSRVLRAAVADRGERELLDAVVAGDESAFVALVDANSSWMMRTALLHVSSRAVAEEVVQDAWLNVLRALERFEGRSSFRTWLFAIVSNAARKEAAREGRSTAFSALPNAQAGVAERESLVDRFFDGSHPRWANSWNTIVDPWDRLPEERLVSEEVRRTIETVVQGLPPAQRAVFQLRDREGWSAGDVCDALELTDANQRVLLHRARLKVREALERYFHRQNPA
ncbi:MAG: sigma-70 family RNA polymerase sigma factor [Actinomycetota bacterium]|nr:sigma-70 family RNA polymerase sigma factor [Actinomycetota bacterium]